MESSSGVQMLIKQLIKEGKYEKALHKLSESLGDHPKDPVILDNLSILTYKLNRFKESLDYTLQLLEIEPDNSDLYNRVGQIYLQLGKNDEASKFLTTGLSKSPDSFNLNYNLGKLQEKLNNTTSAIKFYRTALKIRPDLRKPYEKLAKLFKAQSSIQELEQLIDLAKPNKVDTGFIYDHLLSLLHLQNDKKKILDTYLKLYEENPETHIHLSAYPTSRYNRF